MTLNQIEKRIRIICEAHKQVRSYFYGMPTDFLTRDRQYAAVCVQDTTGSLELVGKQDVYGFKLFVIDLVHVSQDTKENEKDVMSDMREIAKDILATMDHSEYTDWKLSSSNPVTFVVEEDGDMYAGVSVDISITAMWEKNVCAVPTDEIDIDINGEDMKLVYEAYRKCTGSEGTSLNLATDFVNYDGSQVDLTTKKILLLTRSNVTHKKITSGTAILGEQFKLTATQVQFNSDQTIFADEPIFVLYRTA